MIGSGFEATGKSAVLSEALAPVLLEAVRADRPDQSSSTRHELHADGEGKADRITLSVEGLLMAAAGGETELDLSHDPGAGGDQMRGDEKAAGSPNTGSDEELSSGEAAELRELKQRDAQVRAHENAHLRTLGPYRTGGASFQFETGADGRRYAISGEVPVDVSAERTPEETIRKAQTVRRAALAPADPSSADRGVAADAAKLEREARAEIAREKQEEVDGDGSGLLPDSPEDVGQYSSSIKTKPHLSVSV